MKTRMIIVRRKCPFCRDAIKVINKINLNLPLDKRIDVIDAWQWEEFGVDSLPILKKLEKDGLMEGFPLLIIDGVRIEPAPTSEQMDILLKTYLKEDFLY